MKTKDIFIIYALCSSIYFLQGISGLPGLPLFLYLKETLGLKETDIMSIQFYVGLAWLVKPLWGALIDNIGTYKKWMSFSIVGSIFAAILFGISPLITVPIVIAISSFSSWCGAIRDVAIDGLACIEGKENNNCHHMQSIQWGSLTVASILAGLAGGYLSDHVSYKVAYLCLIPFYLIALIMVLKQSSTKKKDLISPQNCNYSDECLHENGANCNLSCFANKSIWKTIKSYSELFKNKYFLLVCLFIFLYNFSPSFGIPLQYKMRDSFRWSGLTMGILDAISSVASLIGMTIFLYVRSKFNTKQILKYSIFIGAISTLCYLYFTPITAFIYGIVFGCVGIIISLTLLTWMAEVSLPGKEATSFAMLCSVSNCAASASLWAGKTLLPIVGLDILIVISAFTSFICLPFLRYIKIKDIMQNKITHEET